MILLNFQIWKLFVEDLWEFQYLQKICSLEKNFHLSKVLYEESQGITDIAIKLFMFSQELAISSEEEELTTSIIRSAAKAKLNLLQPALKAFKNKDKKALEQFEDAYPIYLRQSLTNSSTSQVIIGELSNEPHIRIVLNNEEVNTTQKDNQENQTQAENQMAIEEFFKQKTVKSAKSKTKSSKNRTSSKRVLLDIFSSGENSDSEKIYEVLKEKGFVRSGNEFISNIGRTEEVAK